MMFYVPFRYKLTAAFALIIVCLLYAIFNVVQSDIESRFRGLIEADLIEARDYVNQRMDDRYERLHDDATVLVNDKLIRDVLTDDTLSIFTRNDIVTNEVLPRFSHLNVLAVTNSDGELLAQSAAQAKVVKGLLNSEWFPFSLDGEAVAGYIFYQQQFYQGIAMPVFLGQEMIGVVVGARILSLEDIVAIKKISHIDISIIYGHQRILSTEFSGLTATEELIGHFDHWLSLPQHQIIIPDITLAANLGSERFLMRFSEDQTMFVPPYLIVRSLDEAVGFVNNIRNNMEVLGSYGFLIAIVLGFIFAVGVSRPIRRLSFATEEVAKENFSHRVEINSRDEFATLGDSFNQMIADLADKQKIRSAFDKSVSKEVADHMLAQGVVLGGQRAHATILFADIRGFTSLSESLDERALINLLNEYFTQVNQCITQQKGVIDKFIGDAVMALFGTPISNEFSAYSGLLAAHDMLLTVTEFNKNVRVNFGCDLKIGIGLNTGNVVAGMVGASDRLNFTVLGDQVNIASRIEGLCKMYGVDLILSESTVNDILACQDTWQAPLYFRLLDQVQVKGRSRGIKIYEPFIEPSEQQLVLIDLYQQSLKHVFDGQVRLAHSLLVDVNRRWPADQPTLKLLGHCLRYLAKPDDHEREYRQGVRILDEK